MCWPILCCVQGGQVLLGHARTRAEGHRRVHGEPGRVGAGAPATQVRHLAEGEGGGG